MFALFKAPERSPVCRSSAASNVMRLTGPLWHCIDAELVMYMACESLFSVSFGPRSRTTQPHAAGLQVVDWIRRALLEGGAVLVHCHEGKSRSVALLLAYLMSAQGWTLNQALQHIRWGERILACRLDPQTQGYVTH